MLDGLSANLLNEINKKFRKTDSEDMVFDGAKTYDVASTQSVMIDFVTGENVQGVLVKGRLSEVSGMESSGKTTLLLSSAAYAVRVLDWTGIFIDIEGTYDVQYAKALGLEESDKFRVFRPTTAEDAETLFNMLFGVGKGNSKFQTKIDFVIWDSITATTPEIMLDSENSTGDGQAKGVHARYWGNFIKKCNREAVRKNVAFCFVNQLRNKIDMSNQYQEKVINSQNDLAAGFSSDNSKTTTGGQGIKFYFSIRVLLQQTKRLKEEMTIKKKKVNVKSRLNYIKASIMKNKLGIPFKECTTAIQFGKGFRDELPMFDYLKDNTEIITSSTTGVYTFEFGEVDFAVKGLVNFQKKLFTEYLDALKEAYLYEKGLEYEELYQIDEEDALKDLLEVDADEDLDLDDIMDEQPKKKRLVKKRGNK